MAKENEYLIHIIKCLVSELARPLTKEDIECMPPPNQDDFPF